MDYTALPGFRLTGQVGRSFSLSDKVRRNLQPDGFDYRLGFQTYHEINWQTALVSEIYSEGFYVYRYENFLPALQFRTWHRSFSWKKEVSRLELGPIVNGVVSADSKGYDYNRFVEAQLGMRLRYTGPLTLWFTPYYVAGARWERSSNTPTYQDLRILVAGYVSF